MKTISIFFIGLFLFACSNQKVNKKEINLIEHISHQLEYAVQISKPLRDSILISPRTIDDGKLKLVQSRDWTSGFFPGSLWMMYELTGNKNWKGEALQFTLPLESEKWNGGTHDMGFKMYCSFGQAIKYTNDPDYKDILIQSAKTLSTRFLDHNQQHGKMNNRT